MGTETKNLPVTEAEARLAAQLEPRSEGASGARGVDQNYEQAFEEQVGLENVYQSGHDGPTTKS